MDLRHWIQNQENDSTNKVIHRKINDHISNDELDFVTSMEKIFGNEPNAN